MHRYRKNYPLRLLPIITGTLSINRRHKNWGMSDQHPHPWGQTSPPPSTCVSFFFVLSPTWIKLQWDMFCRTMNDTFLSILPFVKKKNILTVFWCLRPLVPFWSSPNFSTVLTLLPKVLDPIGHQIGHLPSSPTPTPPPISSHSM